MNEPDDVTASRALLSEEEADQLLARGSSASSAHLSELTGVVDRMRQSATDEELSSMASTIAAFQRTLANEAGATARHVAERRCRRASKVVVLFGAATIASLGAAAAATGHLSNPFSSAPHTAVSEEPPTVEGANQAAPVTGGQPLAPVEPGGTPQTADVSDTAVPTTQITAELPPLDTAGRADTEPATIPQNLIQLCDAFLRPGPAHAPETQAVPPLLAAASAAASTVDEFCQSLERGNSAGAGESSTPGQSGSTPGQSGVAPPGQSGATPGQSGVAPPGQSGSAPGQSGTQPGGSDPGKHT